MSEPTAAAPSTFGLHDVALVAGIVRRRCTTLIDEETPVGGYVRALERSVVSLEGEVNDWRLRHDIAVDERNRAERRVGELEGALDAVSAAFRKMSAA